MRPNVCEETHPPRPVNLLRLHTASRAYTSIADEDFAVPNGTGPFKYKSFAPGERSVFVRNGAYRIHGGPYVDSVEIISISDPTARLNALAAGQVDAIGQLDFKLASQVTGNSKLRLINAGATGTGSCTSTPTSAFTPTATATQPPSCDRLTPRPGRSGR